MALRVLLADESPTIKKVMQISLQDFSIELKAVQLGIDVVQVAEQFQPDIIFCDVLLQKKSGYEVAQEIKSHPKLRKTPVVLMWSGFMELDEEKFRECRADANIEKPFDSNTLRQIVKNLVKTEGGEAISDFLEFPEVTEFAKKPVPPVPTETPASSDSGDGGGWTMDSFEEITHFNTGNAGEVDSFRQKPLQPLQPESSVKAIKPDIQPLAGDFAQKQFQAVDPGGPQGLKLPEEEDLPREELLANVSMHPSDMDKFNIRPPSKISGEIPKVKPEPEGLRLDLHGARLTEEQLEAVIREQSREVIEKIAWKLVPDIANQMIKDEIHRLMDENKL
jgi:CheY-like chemotaxis protein